MHIFEFQQEGINFLAQRQSALLADDMGLGKTLQLVKTFEALNSQKVLVVCPASVKHHWLNEIKKWSTKQYAVEILEGYSHKIKTSTNIYIVNYELLTNEDIRHQLQKQIYDVLICDEAHYLKTLGTQRTKAVLGRFGLVHKAKHTYLSTGTPILNRPLELYPMLKVLFPEAIEDCFNSQDLYKLKYCDGYRNKWGVVGRGASNQEELAGKIKPFFLRRTKEQVLKELPLKIIVQVPLQLPVQTLKGLKQYEASISSLRQQTALAKVPQCISYINDLLYCKDKIVIFAHHHSVIKALRENLNNFGVHILTGQETAKQKQEAVLQFQKDKKRVFIGQIQAAGLGVDGLQHATDTAVFVEMPWSPAIFDQATDRLCRIGQVSTNIFIHILYAQKTVDENVGRQLDVKKSNIKRIILVDKAILEKFKKVVWLHKLMEVIWNT